MLTCPKLVVGTQAFSRYLAYSKETERKLILRQNWSFYGFYGKYSRTHFTCRNRPGGPSRFYTTPRPATSRPQTQPRPRPSMGYIDVRVNIQRSRFPLNDQINLPCTVNSYSRPNVYWSKNGQRLRSSQRIQVGTTNSLGEVL